MILFLAFLFVFSAVARFMPHPPNFAPIAALGIFAGLYGTRKQAITLPLTARLVSDTLIGFFTPGVMVAVYGSTLIGALLGLWAKKRKNPATVIGVTLLGSIIFFFITNTAVWAFDGMYPRNIAGLLQSYTLAIPFFKYTLLGDIFYVTLLVGGFELALKVNQKIKQRKLVWQLSN